MNNNVPPTNTLLVIEALNKANKDYELIWFPGAAHDYRSFNNYMTRRRWDFFVKNLLGAQPPEGYEITAPAEPVPAQTSTALAERPITR